MNINFETSEENAEFYVAIMTLGLIQGIKNKTIPIDTGIWSLGRPRFWKTIEEHKFISNELLTVVQTLDELSAIEALSLDTTKTLDELADTVNSCLLKINYDTIGTVIDSTIA